MRVIGLVAVGSLACGGTPDPGLVGVVQGKGMTLTDVELFVGVKEAQSDNGCNGNSGIGPRDPNGGVGRCFDGSGWTDPDTTSTFSPVTGTTTFFRFTPDGEPIPALLAVGYDGSNVVGAALVHDVPVGDQPVEIVLAPTSDLLATGTGLSVWRRPGDTIPRAKSACAAIGDDNNGVEFFVPDDDTDCDGASHDCPGNAFNWCFDGPPVGSGAFSCLAQPKGANTECRIGGVGCGEDGLECPDKPIPAGTCVPTQGYAGCVPVEFCQGGHDGGGSNVPGCSVLDPSCFTTIRYANTIHVECTFQVQADVTTGDLISCASTEAVAAPLSFTGTNAVTGVQTCDDVSLLDLMNGLNGTDHVDVTGNIPLNASLRFELASNNCDNQVVFIGKNFPPINVDGTNTTFVGLDVHTGSGGSDEHRLVPASVTFVGCGSGGNASTCNIVPDSSSGVVLPCGG